MNKDFSFKKSEKYGLTFTIVFHVLLILLFLFTGLTYMEPPPPEEGIMINFGFDNQGSGQEQAQSAVQNRQELVKEKVVQESVQSRAEEDVLTQESEEAPKINTENSQ